MEDNRKYGLRPLAGKIDEVSAAREALIAVAELNTPLRTSNANAAFRRIFVATDFSEASGRALCDALALAAENNAQLSVVHGLHPDRKYAALENPYELPSRASVSQQSLRRVPCEF
ncbi:MAG TPA: universal stress protein [Candidatus Sulfotelmatobacter sp.]